MGGKEMSVITSFSVSPEKIVCSCQYLLHDPIFVLQMLTLWSNAISY